MPLLTQEDADLAALAVRRAGDEAAGLFRTGLDGVTKSNESDVVTEADRRAEALVLKMLRRARPDDSVVGEEGAHHEGTSGRTWVIDPVDGTYNFLRGLDGWCSALALRTETDVLLGAVHHPAVRTTWLGSPAAGALRNGTPMRPPADRPLARSCIATYLHPAWYGTAAGDAWQRVVQACSVPRMFGSGSLDATAVAEGHVDLVLQHSVPEWDRLPGEALIRGLGGSAERIAAGGVEWYVAGAPTAVAEACALLAGR